jgi:putative hydrolase of the HAD superfamily
LDAVERTRAVFFDVDFTLIHPGPRFQGAGYEETCRRHGVTADAAAFEQAVAVAATLLESTDQLYDAQIYLAYTRRIVELMGGTGPRVDAVAREIFDDWNQHHHFSLYDDVPEALAGLRQRGIRIGLISNTERCLVSFQEHFELAGFISVTVSSSNHGFMKPHPSIFQAALGKMGVRADEAVMVGDSLVHDVMGARGAGMRGIWLARGSERGADEAGVDVIRSLAELSARL